MEHTIQPIAQIDIDEMNMIEEMVMYRPDISISLKDMNAYGFTGESENPMFPLPQIMALKLYRDDTPIYLLDRDDKAYLSQNGQDIKDWISHGGMVGITYHDNLSVSNHEGLSDPIYYPLTNKKHLCLTQTEDGYDYTISKETKFPIIGSRTKLIHIGTADNPLVSNVQTAQQIVAHYGLSLSSNFSIDLYNDLRDVSLNAPPYPKSKNTINTESQKKAVPSHKPHVEICSNDRNPTDKTGQPQQPAHRARQCHQNFDDEMEL